MTDSPDDTSVVSKQSLGSRYQLVSVLGTGAMGVVWLAKDREDGSEVAAKVLRRELSTDPELVGRFIQERSILLKLTHPSIVRVHDLVVEGDRLAIVMDLVVGGDLRDVLREDETIAPSVACAHLIEVLDALASAHALNILHRDVKPDNVMIDRTGTVPRARLADFSIARLAQETTVRMTGVLGTASYIAPEVFTAETASSAVDVYGAGIMLYELLAGRTPFEGAGNEYAIARRHVNAVPPKIEGLPENLGEIIWAMISKNPAHRPSAAEAAMRLREIGPSLRDVPSLVRVKVPSEWAECEPFRPSTGITDGDASSLPDANATIIRGARRSAVPTKGPEVSGDVQVLTPAGDVVVGGTVVAGKARRTATEEQVQAASAIATVAVPRTGTGLAVKVGGVVALLAVVAGLVALVGTSSGSSSAKTGATTSQFTANMSNQNALLEATVKAVNNGSKSSLLFNFTQGGVVVPNRNFLAILPSSLFGNQCSNLQKGSSDLASASDCINKCAVKVQSGKPFPVEGDVTKKDVNTVASLTSQYFSQLSDCTIAEEFPAQSMSGITVVAGGYLTVNALLINRGPGCTLYTANALGDSGKDGSTPPVVNVENALNPKIWNLSVTGNPLDGCTYDSGQGTYLSGNGSCSVRANLGPFVYPSS